MQFEIEITVLVNTNYEQLEKVLKEKNFEKKEEYELYDNYMIEENIDILNMNNLDILKKCVLVRDIVDIKKELLYKYKKYDINGDIVEQGKVRCPITDTNKAIEFMEAIKYKKLFNIYDKCIVYANDKIELVVQLVNNKYIFIKMESMCQYIAKKYKSINELKEVLNRRF